MNTIDQLLERYWEAETTVSEEQELRAYFASGQVAGKHEAFGALFGYQTMLRGMSTDVSMPGVVSDDILQGGASIRPMSPLSMIMKVAAIGIILLVAIWGIQRQLDTSSAPMATVLHLDDASDAEEAMQVTRDALAYLTAKLDKNTRSISAHVKTVERADIFNY